MNFIKVLPFSLLFLGLVTLFVSCENESTESLVRVRVINSDSIPVQNALVRVFSPGDTTVFTNNNTKGQFQRYSGIDGWLADTTTGEPLMIRLNFGEAYLDVEAKKGGWKGCGFVHVKEGLNYDVTVIIKPFGDLNNGCPQ